MSAELKDCRVSLVRLPWLAPFFAWTSAFVLTALFGAISAFGSRFVSVSDRLFERVLIGGLVGLALALALRVAAIPRIRDVNVKGDAIALRESVVASEKATTGTVPTSRVVTATAVVGKSPTAVFGLRGGGRLSVATGRMIDAENLVREVTKGQAGRFAVRSGYAPVPTAIGLFGISAFVGVTRSLFHWQGELNDLVGDIVDQFAWADSTAGFALRILFAGMTAVAFALWFERSRPVEIEVGVDGIRFEKHLRRSFTAFDSIARVSTKAGVLELTLTNGGTERVPLPSGVDGHVVVQQMEIALAARAQGADAPARLALLERRGRTVKAWRDDLVALVGNAGAYRAAPLTEGNLEAILDAESATNEQRLGAAMALRVLTPEMSTAPLERIRIAAERSASPAVRDALTQIVEDDEEPEYLEAVERALR